MTTGRMLLAIADDLSGAAETAAALHSRTTRSRVLLVGRSGEGDGGALAASRPRRPGEGDSGAPTAAHPPHRHNDALAASRPPHPGEATVLDLDSRYRPAAEAAEAVRDALRLSSPDGDTLVLKKIDSLLRGNLAAEIGALAEDGAGVVLAPALPVGGRVVRSGVVYVNGVALHESDAWRLEATPAPRSIAEALDGLPTTPIPLSTVRAPGHWLLSALRTATDDGRVAVCDAETDADLDTIVEASLAAGPRLRLVGSGGLALALGRLLAATPSPTVTRAATLAPRSTTPGTATSALTSTTPGAANANQAPVRDTASRATPPSPRPDTAAPTATPPSPSTTPAATTPAPPRDTASHAATSATTSTTPGATNQAPPPDTAAPATPPSPGTGRRVLVVVGTAERAAVEQIRRLVEDGAIHHPLPLDALMADGPPVRLPPMTAPVTVVSLSAQSGPPPTAPGPATPHTPTAAPAHGAAALPSPRPAPEATACGPLSAATPPSGGGADDRTEPDRMGPNPTGPNPTEPHLREPDRAGPDLREPDPPGPDHTEPDRGPGRGPEPPSARRLVHGLARAVRDAVAAHPGALDLVLTGGETARRVLDALAVTELDPVGQVHHGAVHLSTPDGRSVVTRPGSFGDPDSLRHIVQALRLHPTERKVTS
ncbi:four-carbon acid sugar kinase family protein [Streptomyces hygroscopicus]|uniref:four-carbon acid sugar kinase family protein n=1 Tax=Streptomyces hygroscopicus TaxID=1912 RepID=UPI0036BF0522